MSKIQAGTISHGTLRTADLLNAFLPYLDESSLIYGEALAMIQTLESGANESEESSEILHSVMDSLDALAPAGMFFGTLEGDASDFGFWYNEAGGRAILAQELSSAFEHKARDNGESFYCLNDTAPEWMKEAIHAAHGNMFPNDWSYRIGKECADSIAEILAADCDSEFDESSDEAWERIDSLIPCYNSERLNWLASHSARVDYCDEAREEGLVSIESDMLECIAAGMLQEYRAVWAAIASAIRDEAA